MSEGRDRRKMNSTDWILLAPKGNLAMCRRPLPRIPEGGRLATGAELLAANLGKPFPWGQLPTPAKASVLWKSHRMGVGGLFHTAWFLTADGRLGGAPNVPETLPGSLRSCLFFDGGLAPEEQGLEENEGYAVVMPATRADEAMFRAVQLHAAEHVMADGGSVIVSPIQADGRVFVGFVGRCQHCPNAELISFRQLQSRLPEYSFELWPEWRGWTSAFGARNEPVREDGGGLPLAAKPFGPQTSPP